MRALKLAPEQVHTGSLILVNREHGCMEFPYALSGSLGADALSPLDNRFTASVLLKRRAAVLLTGLMDEIGGWQKIVPVSGYRTLAEQTDIWESSLAEHGEAFTKAYVAFPGHSEHQTGLAIDLGLKQEHVDFICPEFPYSGICQTFREKSAKYGFILRYPGGKEDITGIGHEPWHFRYVGAPHAEIMTRQELCLEEYIDFIKQYTFQDNPYRFMAGNQKISVSYLKAEGMETLLKLPENMPYTVSGNNMDGFILTEWRSENAYQRQLRMA